ncbi:hypothetical protein AWV80_05340 [Cupriavidus sp. UYMU48A]|nr:hypothetical protein AWV80_05340 [Cupriavidus sp. UYMU48A]
MEAEFAECASEIGEKYQELKKLYPRDVHAELTARLSASERRVLTRARLKELGIEPAPRSDKAAHFATLDAALAAHIPRRSRTLRAVGFSGRLSSHKLLEGFPTLRPVRELLDSGMLPKGKAVLLEYEETAEDYRRRLLKVSVAAGFVNQIPAGEEDRVDSLADGEVKRLNKAVANKRWERRLRN